MECAKSFDNVCSEEKWDESLTLIRQHAKSLERISSERCSSSGGTYIEFSDVSDGGDGGEGGDAGNPNRNCQRKLNVWQRVPSKALRIKFYRNSNAFFKGFVLPVSRERYRTFDMLLEDLTKHFSRHVVLTKAISVIVRMRAGGRDRKICGIEDFMDEKVRRPAVKKLEEHNAKTSNSTEKDASPASVCKQPESALTRTMIRTPTMPEFMAKALVLEIVVSESRSSLVYEVCDKRLGNKYVLKHIKKDKITGECSELRIMSQLRGHPNVLAARLTHENPNSGVILMDSMTCDLLRVVEDFGVFSNTTAQSVMYMLASGLVYIHEKRIIHRDIKPENIFVDLGEHGNILRLKIADFGLATPATSRPLFSRCGTPHYMAPEIITFEGYNKPVDCWATGVLLYNIMCGQRPFGHMCGKLEDIYRTIVARDMSYEPLQNEAVSAEAIFLIHRLLCKIPRIRLTAVEILNHPFVAKKSY